MTQRSNPDEILKQIVKLSAGRHRLYIGMAPGVGKTHRMLEEAKEMKRRGIDIVIGYIENQNRPDNLKIISQLEVIPMKKITINNCEYTELDLETILERKPACVVIDELAHSNIPGSLNSKRYQDVLELIKNGISVLSTINVHQIESIAPIVEKNIGIRINETVPDWVINKVDELMVIDMPIDELYKRLETKKIYTEEQLKHALKNFFKKNNLLMLRDLALNFLAEKVDTEVVSEKLKAKIKERILVAIATEEESIKVINHAILIAKTAHADLDIICFSNELHKQIDKLVSEFRELTKGVKGNFILISESTKNISDILVKYIKSNRITLFITNRKSNSQPFISEILSKSNNLDVLYIGENENKISYTKENSDSIKRSNEFIPGKLKIYIGMAPGVGKTYKMLQEARELCKSDKNILLGVIDTHNREETAKLMAGLPVLPLKLIKHQDKFLQEFDLEAAILAKPEVIFVDELAHTNVPGSINNKRYQDVQYLLRAGINVVTAINIQHIESLNDIVEQFSGIKVRETVPDWIISHANEIVLIDISPEALQERLKEGKVYSLDKIEQALAHFFQKKNLIALRELSLKEVAENVEHQLHPVDKTLRVLSIVDINDETLRLIRKSARIANRIQAELIVTHIVNNTNKLLDSRKISIIQLEELVVELGGDFRLIEGKNLIDEICKLETKLKPYYIIISQSLSQPQLPLFKYNKLTSLLNKIRDAHVLIIGDYIKEKEEGRK